MAERRMLTKKITDSDAFIELPASAQALYMHLNQGADDDGFNNQIQNAMYKAHASIDDVKVLLTKNFIIRFESGVIVIKHWRMHNLLRKDRYKPTDYQEELNMLGIKENGSYTLNNSDGCQLVAKRLPQVRLGKVSIDNKESKKEDTTKNENIHSFNEIIDNFTQNEELRQELKNHLKVRKQKKGALTNRAIELELKTLSNLSKGNEDVELQIVRQSIEKGWIGFFEVKSYNKTNDTSDRVLEALYGK